MTKLTFYGAAKQVTGSMYLLETPSGKRILVECGWEADRDRSREAPQTQEELFPFVPSRPHLFLHPSHHPPAFIGFDT